MSALLYFYLAAFLYSQVAVLFQGPVVGLKSPVILTCH